MADSNPTVPAAEPAASNDDKQKGAGGRRRSSRRPSRKASNKDGNGQESASNSAGGNGNNEGNRRPSRRGSRRPTTGGSNKENAEKFTGKNTLTFALNGERVTVRDPDPVLTLNDYLRTSTRFKGTKLSCGEGGCGACAVVISYWENGAEVTTSANSCLTPLCAIDGYSVTTTEGLGNKKDGFHPIQERIAGFNGTQCGFCTPGMVMSVYGALREFDNNPEGFTQEEAEIRLDGNICRCTGYRPILDTIKSFAGSSTTGNQPVTDMVNGTSTGTHDPSKNPKFPEWLKNYNRPKIAIANSGIKWFTARNLADVFTLTKQHKNAKLVAGNTMIGIYKVDNAVVYVDIRNVPELRRVNEGNDALEIGAGQSLSSAVRVFRDLAKRRNNHSTSHLPTLASAILRIGNHHVRNVGTLAGNLMMAKNKGFASDLATMLCGAGASVTVASAGGPKTLPLTEFLTSPKLNPGEVLQSVSVPYAQQGEVLRVFKVAVRPQNAHAFANAAFRVQLDGSTIKKATVVVGALDRHAERCTNTEKVLEGRKVDDDTLAKAMEALNGEVNMDHIGNAAYKSSLLSSYLYKTFVALAKQSGAKMADAVQTAEAPAIPHAVRPVSSGSQTFQEHNHQAPVSKPVVKLQAKEQASGDAVYTDDVTHPDGCLYAAFVGTSVAHGKILKVNTDAALKMARVRGFISHADIPGHNNCGTLGEPELLFVPTDGSGETTYAGQPIGLIVAETPRHAWRAAAAVKVSYEKKKPVLSLDAGVAEGTTLEGVYMPTTDIEPKTPSDEAIKACSQQIAGRITCGSQLHFYMETQTALAIPSECGSYTIYSSNQFPQGIQSGVSQTVGVPLGDVTVICPRAGGGFGGKLTRAALPAAAVAVAAHAMKAPVRMAVKRDNDMKMVGGRHVYRTDYEVGFDDDGTIKALKANTLLDAGHNVDLTPFCAFAFNRSLNQIYDIPNFEAKARGVRTNIGTKTATRGPGEIQASAVIETIIEHVAFSTGKTPMEIREKNMYPDSKDITDPKGAPVLNYTIPLMWDKLKEKTNFDKRYEEVTQFNKENRWTKRGISMTPVRYGVKHLFPTGALVNIYGDGSVIVAHGGCEIGQGINTKVVQAAAFQLSKIGVEVPMDSIRVAMSNTDKIPNMSMTGGSTQSEASTEAVRICCERLVERIKPVAEGLKEKGPLSWSGVAQAAVGARVNMGEQFSLNDNNVADPLGYDIFGVCVSEIQLDVLTGETTILSSEIMYDCGYSLNPAIDIGQAEGAFVMGLGALFREEVRFNRYGILLSDGTWNYKPPCSHDVPVKFTVDFLKDVPFDKGIMSSKASGEPPLVLAVSAWTALRQAITSAREDAGVKEFFVMDTPMTPDRIHRACQVDKTKMTMA